jgi:hypothetical protein
MPHLIVFHRPQLIRSLHDGILNGVIRLTRLPDGRRGVRYRDELIPWRDIPRDWLPLLPWQMAVTVGTWGDNSGSGALSYSYTIPAGSNRYGLVFVGLMCTAAPTSVTVTVGGNSTTAFTGNPKTGHPAGGSDTLAYGFYLLEASMPGTGAQTVAVTITGGTAVVGRYVTTIVSTDANQAAPSIGGNGTASGTTITCPSAGTLTVQNGGAGFGYVIGNDSAGRFTASVGWTERADESDGDSFDSGNAYYDRTYSANGTDSVTFTGTNVNHSAWMVVLDPVGGGGGGGRIHRASPLDGIGGVGQQRFNPSLSYHRHPEISLAAYRRELQRAA